MIARLEDPSQRERIKSDMGDPNATTWENQWYGAGGADGVMLSTVLNPDLRKYEGMTFTAIGKGDTKVTVTDFGLKNTQSQPIVVAGPEVDVKIQ